MSFTEWIVLATVCLAGASSPGPSLALLIRSVIRDGRIAGIVFGIAHGIGILLYAGLVTMGLGAVMVLLPVLSILLEVAGLAFLLWLATGMVRAGLAPGADAATSEVSVSLPLIRHARDGFMIVFLNPKIAAFFLAIFSQFLSTDQGAAVQVLMVMTAFFVDAGWYVMIAFIIAMPGLMRRLETRARQLELVIGLVLMLICAVLAWRLLTGM